MPYWSQFHKMYQWVSYYIPRTLWWAARHFVQSKSNDWIWSARKACVVAVVRAIFNDPSPKSMQVEQLSSLAYEYLLDPTMEVIAVTLTVPSDNNLLETMKNAISDLSDSSYAPADVHLAPSVTGEWVIDTPMATDEWNSPEHIKQEGQAAMYLYLHGGQFFLRNPASRRGLVHALVRNSNARCFSLAYRLSPQNVFPSALLDLAVAYLSLLYPDTQSGAAAVSPTAICICGDSSGANIAIAFLQLILHLQRQDSSRQARVRWRGADVVLPCPATIVAHSGYMDLTRSLPSEINNLDLDVLPTPRKAPMPSSSYIQDMIWPSDPARHHVYAPTELLMHPLVSPVTATDWRACPTKILFILGQECLLDGNALVAQSMAAQGVPVRLDLYEGMPHDFLLLFASSAMGNECLASWRDFVQESVLHPAEACVWPHKGLAILRGPSAGQLRMMPISELNSPVVNGDLLNLMQAQIQSWGSAATRS